MQSRCPPSLPPALTSIVDVGEVTALSSNCRRARPSSSGSASTNSRAGTRFKTSWPSRRGAALSSVSRTASASALRWRYARKRARVDSKHLHGIGDQLLQPVRPFIHDRAFRVRRYPGGQGYQVTGRRFGSGQWCLELMRQCIGHGRPSSRSDAPLRLGAARSAGAQTDGRKIRDRLQNGVAQTHVREGETPNRRPPRRLAVDHPIDVAQRHRLACDLAISLRSPELRVHHPKMPHRRARHITQPSAARTHSRCAVRSCGNASSGSGRAGPDSTRRAAQVTLSCECIEPAPSCAAWLARDDRCDHQHPMPPSSGDPRLSKYQRAARRKN